MHPALFTYLNLSKLRAMISYYLSRKLGMPSAEIARQLVCISAIVKAIQNAEPKNEK